MVPDPCTSTSTDVTDEDEAKPLSPVSTVTMKNESLEDINRLDDEELEFDQFLMDAAEWL